VKAAGITKTVLLSSSPNARVISTPAKVELNSVKTEEDLRTFATPFIPVAVLLEGKFNSLYTNRISSATKDSLEHVYKSPFLSASANDFLNCLEYLVSNPGILETRGKDYTLRLLDRKQVEAGKSFWQMLNIGLPVLLVLLFALLYSFLIRRRYSG